MPDAADADEVIGAARLLIAGFDLPFQTEGVLLALGVNIGIAVYPEMAIDTPSLKDAPTSRPTPPAPPPRCGSSTTWSTTPPPCGASRWRRTCGRRWRRLDVCFQPKVELATGIGAEALVRWNHMRLGRVRPDEFITIAEHTGDIRALTMVVMRKALAQCRHWRA